MARKKRRKPSRHFCQNEGGLWIERCNGNRLATVTLHFRPKLEIWETDKLRLCARCAEQVKHHAEMAGYEVEIEEA
jgi:hypothetical protein